MIEQIPDWNVGLNTGNANIDYLRQVLLELARKAIQACDESEFDRKSYHAILNELFKTINELFEVEEIVLSERGGPTLPQHRAEHRHLRKEVVELLVKASISKNIDRESLCKIFVDWSIRHLLTTDMVSRPYMVPERSQ